MTGYSTRVRYVTMDCSTTEPMGRVLPRGAVIRRVQGTAHTVEITPCRHCILGSVMMGTIRVATYAVRLAYKKPLRFRRQHLQHHPPLRRSYREVPAAAVSLTELFPCMRKHALFSRGKHIQIRR